MTLSPGSAVSPFKLGYLSRAYSAVKTGILNPAINSLLCRIRHTNTLVISDRGFPFWPQDRDGRHFVRR